MFKFWNLPSTLFLEQMEDFFTNNFKKKSLPCLMARPFKLIMTLLDAL